MDKPNGLDSLPALELMNLPHTLAGELENLKEMLLEARRAEWDRIWDAAVGHEAGRDCSDYTCPCGVFPGRP